MRQWINISQFECEGECGGEGECARKVENCHRSQGSGAVVYRYHGMCVRMKCLVHIHKTTRRRCGRWWLCERGGGCEWGGRGRGRANVEFSDDHNFCRHRYICRSVRLMCIMPKTTNTWPDLAHSHVLWRDEVTRREGPGCHQHGRRLRQYEIHHLVIYHVEVTVEN